MVRKNKFKKSKDMIKINNSEIKVGHYPDHTQAFDYTLENITSVNKNSPNIISWFYDSDEELYTLKSVVHWVRRIAGKRNPICLTMPYCPYARMDRVKDFKDNASLEVFANDINMLDFEDVWVYNVHSVVSEALINYVTSCKVDGDVEKVIEKYDPDVVFFPDEGACKRYSDLQAVKNSRCDVGFGIKKRVFRTNEILGLDVIADFDLNGKKVLIIDDICSAGGTFKHSAKKLKEMGATDVALYISHCEDNIQNGDLLKTDLISKIYTTDSILKISDPKIEVIRKFRN